MILRGPRAAGRGREPLRPPELQELLGCEVTRVCLDLEVKLLLARGAAGGDEEVAAELNVGVPFRVRFGSDERDPVTPVEVDPATAAGYERLPALLRRRLRSVTVHADESLTVAFDGPVEVVVPHHDRFESWAVTGTGVEDWLAGP